MVDGSINALADKVHKQEIPCTERYALHNSHIIQQLSLYISNSTLSASAFIELIFASARRKLFMESCFCFFLNFIHTLYNYFPAHAPMVKIIPSLHGQIHAQLLK